MKRMAAVICLVLTVSALACSTTAPGGGTDDAVLASRVEEALRNDPEVARYDIAVSADQGTVVLSGTVATAAAASKAGRIAETIPGVQQVKNLISIGPVMAPLR